MSEKEMEFRLEEILAILKELKLIQETNQRLFDHFGYYFPTIEKLAKDAELLYKSYVEEYKDISEELSFAKTGIKITHQYRQTHLF